MENSKTDKWHALRDTCEALTLLMKARYTGNAQENSLPRPAGCKNGIQSANNELTDSALEIRRMVSPNREAHDN